MDWGLFRNRYTSKPPQAHETDLLDRKLVCLATLYILIILPVTQVFRKGGYLTGERDNRGCSNTCVSMDGPGQDCCGCRSSKYVGYYDIDTIHQMCAWHATDVCQLWFTQSDIIYTQNQRGGCYECIKYWFLVIDIDLYNDFLAQMMRKRKSPFRACQNLV